MYLLNGLETYIQENLEIVLESLKMYLKGQLEFVNSIWYLEIPLWFINCILPIVLEMVLGFVDKMTKICLGIVLFADGIQWCLVKLLEHLDHLLDPRNPGHFLDGLILTFGSGIFYIAWKS